MKLTFLSRRAIAAFLAAATIIPLVGGLALAGKPNGGGGSASGTIFFTWGSEYGGGGSPPYYEDRGFWTMNADGSSKQLAYRPSDMWDLSHLVHQGHRWFLTTGPSPSGVGPGGMYAVRDDGDGSVLLVQAAELPDGYYIDAKRWGKDDSFLSFVAVDGLSGAGEIWAASISFDADTGVPSLTTAPIPVVDDAPAAILDFDFSPSGDEVVYHLDTGEDSFGSLLIKNLVHATTRGLLANARSPRWSPDGTRIACEVSGDGIYVINPDGTGPVGLTNGGYLSDWSPDGKHILFTRVWWKNGPGTSIYYADVMRVPVNGGGATTLTKDIDGTAWAAFWR